MRRFWLLAFLLLAGYMAFAWWFPLIGRASQLPLADVRALAPTLYHAFLYALLLCALFAGYWMAYRFARQRMPAPWSIFLATILFALPLIVAYPVNAVDVFRYFYEGRMMVEYGLNPLTTPPEAVTDDPLRPFAAILMKKSSPYGPLWELLCALIYRLSRGSILWGLILFKVTGLLAHLVAGFVIWRLLAVRQTHLATAQLLLWLWNPALLFMFVVDAHNDILMLLCLLLGYQRIGQRQPVIGLLILVLAPLIKPVGLLAIPFVALEAWQQMAGWQQRLRLLFLTGFDAILLTTIAFLPFGSPMPLLLRLMDEAQTSPSFSPVAFVLALGEARGVEVPLLPLARAASLLFLLVALILVWLTWRGRSPLAGVADIFAAYLYTALKFRIWYPTWLFPWLVLDPQSHFRLYTAIWLLLLSQLSVILYGHLRVAWLDESLSAAVLYGVPIVFVGSPLLGYLSSKLRPLARPKLHFLIRRRAPSL